MNKASTPVQDSADHIDWTQLSLVFLPLAKPICDAEVLTGRQARRWTAQKAEFGGRP
jgi:hypothetical protein